MYSYFTRNLVVDAVANERSCEYGLRKNDFHFSVIDCVRGDIVGDVSTRGRVSNR